MLSPYLLFAFGVVAVHAGPPMHIKAPVIKDVSAPASADDTIQLNTASDAYTPTQPLPSVRNPFVLHKGGVG